MKRKRTVCLAAALLTAGLLAGCSPENASQTAVAVVVSGTEKMKTDAETELAEKEQTPLITVRREDEVGIPEKLVLYSSLPFQFKAEDWKIELYAQGETGESGELLFDDNSWFFMKVVSSDGEYEFFDEAVQLGIPSAEALTDLEGRLHIIVKDARTAQYEITDYLYDEDSKKFTGTKVMDYGGINYLGGTRNGMGSVDDREEDDGTVERIIEKPMA